MNWSHTGTLELGAVEKAAVSILADVEFVPYGARTVFGRYSIYC